MRCDECFGVMAVCVGGRNGSRKMSEPRGTEDTEKEEGKEGKEGRIHRERTQRKRQHFSQVVATIICSRSRQTLAVTTTIVTRRVSEGWDLHLGHPSLTRRARILGSLANAAGYGFKICSLASPDFGRDDNNRNPTR